MYDMANDRLFSFRLPSDVLDELERVAESEDRTIADIVRRAIRREIAPPAATELKRTGVKRRGRARGPIA
jgi:predicted transcriptional regulator